VALGLGDAYRKYSYDFVVVAALRASEWFKDIQNGIINVYILYIFAILVVTLMVAMQ
jgi:hypothetical protein